MVKTMVDAGLTESERSIDTTRWIAPVGAIRRIPHLAQ